MTQSPFLMMASTVLFLSSALPAEAAVGVRMPLPDLVSSSALVVRGKVTQSVPYRDASTKRIMTRHTLQVAEVWKGKAGSVVTVSTLGGELEELGQWVPGEAVFEPEQEVVAFLVAAAPGEFVVNAMAQGLFRVVLQEGRLRAVRDLSGILFVGEPDTLAPQAGKGGQESLELEKLRELCRRNGK